MLPNNIPLGIVQVYDKETDTTTVSWSYLESIEEQYFELQYYDEAKRQWVPFDGRNGIVKREL